MLKLISYLMNKLIRVSIPVVMLSITKISLILLSWMSIALPCRMDHATAYNTMQLWEKTRCYFLLPLGSTSLFYSVIIVILWQWMLKLLGHAYYRALICSRLIFLVSWLSMVGPSTLFNNHTALTFMVSSIF